MNIEQNEMAQRCQRAAESLLSNGVKGSHQGAFAKALEKLKIEDPIAREAKDGFYIHENGAAFAVDNLRKTLSLGNMDPGQDILRVPLTTGYTLLVNRDNLGQLKDCLDLFSAEDVKRIMCAIAAANKFEGDLMQNEEEETKQMKELVDNASRKDTMEALEESLRLQARARRDRHHKEKEALELKISEMESSIEYKQELEQLSGLEDTIMRDQLIAMITGM